MPVATAPDPAREPTSRTSTVDPTLLVDDPRFSYFAQLHLPGGGLP
jgi:hypothetical protein